MTEHTRRRLIAAVGSIGTIGIAGCSGGGGGGGNQPDYIEQIQPITYTQDRPVPDTYLEVELTDPEPVDKINYRQDGQVSSRTLPAGQTKMGEPLSGPNAFLDEGPVDIFLVRDGEVIAETTYELNKEFVIEDVSYHLEEIEGDEAVTGIDYTVRNTGDLPIRFADTEFTGSGPKGEVSTTSPLTATNGLKHNLTVDGTVRGDYITFDGWGEGSCPTDESWEANMAVNAEYGDSKEINISYSLGNESVSRYNNYYCAAGDIDWEVANE